MVQRNTKTLPAAIILREYEIIISFSKIILQNNIRHLTEFSFYETWIKRKTLNKVEIYIQHINNTTKNPVGQKIILKISKCYRSF